MSLIYGYDKNNNCNGSCETSQRALDLSLELAYGSLYNKPVGSRNKTFIGKIEFQNYGNPKMLKAFKKGIVLLGISTRSSKNIDLKDTVVYGFYDASGSKHLSAIQGKHYKVIEKAEDIPSTLNAQTSLVPCSILASLKGVDIKVNKPIESVILKVTIQYIELQTYSTYVSSIRKYYT